MATIGGVSQDLSAARGTSRRTDVGDRRLTVVPSPSAAESAAEPLTGRSGTRSTAPGGVVETLLLATVIALVSGLVLASVVAMNQRRARLSCDTDISRLALAAQAYRARFGEYPAAASELVTGGWFSFAVEPDHVVRYRRSADAATFVVTGQIGNGDPCRTAVG